MTKLERDLLAIIKTQTYGFTQAELVQEYIVKHSGPALENLQNMKPCKVQVLSSSFGPRIAPYIRHEKFL